MIVLDASAVVELLLRTARGDQVAAMIDSPSVAVHAPFLVHVEVLQVLRRGVSAGWLTEVRAAQAVDDLGNLDVVAHDHAQFLRRMWELKSNLTAYDAAYVALAESIDASLVTADRKLVGAPGHRATVVLI